MTTAALHPPRRAEVGLVALALAVVAWVLTGERMRGMDAGPAASSATSAGSPSAGC